MQRRKRLMRDMIVMGSVPHWSVQFNGTTSVINCASDAGLDNLADNAFTAEAWVKMTAAGQNCVITKGTAAAGWELRDDGANLSAYVYCATTVACSIATTTINDGNWHHTAMTFNDAGDRKIDVFVDGAEVTYVIQQAGVDAIVSDAANNLLLGARNVNDFPLTGFMGWARVSNNVRYAGAFTPSRLPPALDANTLAQWNMSEGTGVTADNVGSLGAAADGTITDGTWVKWF